MFKRLVAAAACLVAVASAEHVQLKIRRGEIGSRAANLGGWLLTEYWMCYTSPLYKGVEPGIGITGEYGVMKELGKEVGTKQFEEHWKSWITEKDIAEIAKSGLNTIRVSTGYWIINDEDDRDTSEVANTYPRGGLKYLDTLINEWAVKYDLAVMISLHAHKGSQNGMDHSAPAVMGKVTWSEDPANAVSSLNYATFLANRYKDSVAFLGLNLMNEPTTAVDYGVLFKYYNDAYKAIREDGNDCIIVTSPWLQEQGPPTMANFMPCPEFYNVWHEFHVYYKWGWEDVPMEKVYSEAGNYAETHFKAWTGNPVFLGEWSLATGDEEARTEAELTKFAKIQMAEAEQAQAGWAFWAWRHDDETKRTSGWSMRQLLKKGIIKIPTGTYKGPVRNPKCPTVKDHKYKNQTLVKSSDLGSGSGSVGAAPIQLFTPDTVKAPNTDNMTAPATTAPATTTSAAQSVQLMGAAVAVAASSLLAMTL